MSFYSHPKMILKRLKIYALHKEELNEQSIEDYNKILSTLQKAPKPLLQFIYSYFYDYAEVYRNNIVTMYISLSYTTKLMKYDEYCHEVGITRSEFNHYMTQTCDLIYDHYFKRNIGSKA